MESSKVIFDKSKITEDDEDDTWDDRALIRAYERSMKKVRGKLSELKSPASATEAAAARIEAYREEAKDDDDEEEEDEDEEDDDQFDDELIENADLKKKANPNDWKVGDLCMAVYTQDGLAYPANIIKIEGNKCTVRYLNYLNVEEKTIEDLFEHTGEKLEPKSEAKTQGQFIPPPPPMPIPTIPAANPNLTEEDALNSMLISWYMSGYHTGFYHGLRNSKTTFK